MGKFCQCLTELFARGTIMARYYSITFLLSATSVGRQDVIIHTILMIPLINPCPAEPGYTLPLQTV